MKDQIFASEEKVSLFMSFRSFKSFHLQVPVILLQRYPNQGEERNSFNHWYKVIQFHLYDFEMYKTWKLRHILSTWIEDDFLNYLLFWSTFRHWSLLEPLCSWHYNLINTYIHFIYICVYMYHGTFQFMYWAELKLARASSTVQIQTVWGKTGRYAKWIIPYYSENNVMYTCLELVYLSSCNSITLIRLVFRSTKIKQKMIIDSGLDDFDEVEDDPLEKAIETK